MADTIPEIIVEGYDLPVFGLDLEVGLAEGPSSIKLSFVEKAGYEMPELSLTETVSIKIGELYSFDYYPIEKQYSTRESGGRLVNIEFVDQSILLDKIYIGLYGTHGFETELPLLLVGQEIDPCKSIVDGEVSEETNDPCDPCRDEEGDFLEERLINCQNERSYSILDVEYSFSDLIDAIEEYTTIEVEGTPNSNDDYKARYSGSLREVLRQWGSDYGFTFYWGEDNKLYFLDLREDIEIDDETITDSKLVSANYVESLKGTVGRGVAAYFKKSGEKREYNCDSSWCKKINMRPISLDNIFGGTILDPYQSLDRLQAMCSMSKYSSSIRDAYIWFIWADIDSASVADLFRGKPNAPQMKLLGLNILKVIDPIEGAGNSKIIGNKIIKEIFAEDTDAIKKFKENDGYFFIAEKKDDIHSQWYEFESTIASEFIGRYFVRKFSEKNAASYSYLTPDADSLKYYPESSAIQLPFVNYLYNDIKTANNFLQNLVDPLTGETADSFLLLERNALWWPTQSSEEFNNINKELENYLPKEISSPSLDKVAEDLNIGDKQIKFFMCQKRPDGFTVSNVAEVDHPEENKYTNQPIEACGSNETYGLRNALCGRYTISLGKTDVKIYTPSQGNRKEDGHAGYDVLWDRNGNRKWNIYQKKIQRIKSKLPPFDSNTMETDILVRDATQDVIDLFNSDPDNLCNPLENVIDAHLDNFIDNMDYQVNSARNEKTYEIKGLPSESYQISQGLSSMQIRIDGTEGLTTTLKFSNKNRVRPSFETFYKKYEEWHKPLKKRTAALTGDADKPESMVSI